MDTQKTLTEAIRFFAVEQNCIDTVAAMRWPEGKPICPKCSAVEGERKHYWLAVQKRWKCYACRKQFSVKVGTIFEDSALTLDKWLIAMWMLANCRNGVSSYEIHRTLGVHQKSAWFILQRIRYAMGDEATEKIGGSPKNPVQIDETFVGGQPKNRHSKQRSVVGDKKAIVMGMLASQTREVRAMVIPNAKRETLQKKILEHVGWGAHIHTAQWVGYEGVDATNLFVHKTVNHMTQYVNGKVHTQGIENFWALLKRTLKGTYVAVEPFHLDRYLAEQVFRYNNRLNKTDADRFGKVLSQVSGKRLTYAELTGKEGVREA